MRSSFALALLLLISSGPAPAQVVGDPKELVVQAADLPGTFAVNGGDYQPDGSYVAMFMRPEVLASPDLPQGALLGVLANVELESDAEAARRTFAEGSDLAAVRESLERSGRIGSRVQALQTGLESADEAVLYRVEYTLQGVAVIEYRYRLRLDNAVASLLVSGRAGDGGVEPTELAEQARQLAELQLGRLLGARSREESG